MYLSLLHIYFGHIVRRSGGKRNYGNFKVVVSVGQKLKFWSKIKILVKN